MSRSKRKYLFQNDQNTLNGALLAGNNSMAEMLLWSLVLLPPVIGVYGAGVCFINIGLYNICLVVSGKAAPFLSGSFPEDHRKYVGIFI